MSEPRYMTEYILRMCTKRHIWIEYVWIIG
jgi:hypothetical protein